MMWGDTRWLFASPYHEVALRYRSKMDFPRDAMSVAITVTIDFYRLANHAVSVSILSSYPKPAVVLRALWDEVEESLPYIARASTLGLT